MYSAAESSLSLLQSKVSSGVTGVRTDLPCWPPPIPFLFVSGLGLCLQGRGVTIVVVATRRGCSLKSLTQRWGGRSGGSGRGISGSGRSGSG